MLDIKVYVMVAHSWWVVTPFITFCNELVHCDLVSPDSEHFPNEVAASAAGTGARTSSQSSALRLRHARKLLHSCFSLADYLPKQIQQFPTSICSFPPPFFVLLALGEKSLEHHGTLPPAVQSHQRSATPLTRPTALSYAANAVGTPAADC